ncbi:hypothetical protein [Niveibacterium microcysteis]|uniref:EF-hand domain-containing protein n=1 Tax=Niveibacterium microcysteis TaxID=2811415 RepID=A0ABX7M6N0_9RHOO|nr:hypothetical protein [Niveibacterium microcysteis]QSI76393.1 hypothetical protein JY500_18320 [Niveibacterium microcysteis]
MFQSSTIPVLLTTAALSLTLAACGGGGAGEPPPPSPLPTDNTPTEITSDNMNMIAASGMLSAGIATFDAWLGGFSGANASSIVLRQFNAAVAVIPASTRISRSQATPPELAMSPPRPPELLIPISKSPCPDGGNIDISVLDSNGNSLADQNEPFRVTANTCKDGDETASGYFEIFITSLTWEGDVVSSADYVVSLSSFTASKGSRSNSLGGTLSVKLRSVAGHSETTMQGTPSIMHSDGERQLPIGYLDNSYHATVTKLDAGVQVDFSSRSRLGDGGVNTPLSGLVLTRTTNPIRYSADRKIVSGTIRISLEGKPATLDINFADDAATVALDVDGDGTVDTTRILTRQALEAVF